LAVGRVRGHNRAGRGIPNWPSLVTIAAAAEEASHDGASGSARTARSGSGGRGTRIIGEGRTNHRHRIIGA
jgi:hypothetical protein